VTSCKLEVDTLFNEHAAIIFRVRVTRVSIRLAYVGTVTSNVVTHMINRGKKKIPEQVNRKGSIEM
jgi:hypothetical protein